VCLRNGFRVIGVLRSYDLTFNVACIEIMGNWNLVALRVSAQILLMTMVLT
jgi:small nuclear ribonucleoprotein (snRNP)-like protein